MQKFWFSYYRDFENSQKKRVEYQILWKVWYTRFLHRQKNLVVHYAPIARSCFWWFLSGFYSTFHHWYNMFYINVYFLHKCAVLIYDISYIDNLFCIRCKCQIIPSWVVVLVWAQSFGKQHGIVVFTIYSDTANRMNGKKDELIMSCESGENYKKKVAIVGNILQKWNVHLCWDLCQVEAAERLRSDVGFTIIW